MYQATVRATKETVAVKELFLGDEEEDVDSVIKEIQLLKDCHSRFITAYYGSFLKANRLYVPRYSFLFHPISHSYHRRL